MPLTLITEYPDETVYGDAFVKGHTAQMETVLASYDALQALWSDLGNALARQGVRVVREGFVPHLTIARDVRAALTHAPIDPVSWRVDGFALVESRPGRPYGILHRREAT